MSIFENAVIKMREAQKRYEQNPTKANLLTKELNEEDVDDIINFNMNCTATSYKEVKEWCLENGY